MSNPTTETVEVDNQRNLSFDKSKVDIFLNDLNSKLKGLRIFINEDLIPEDRDELRKEVKKVKEARKEGKWAIIRNRKAIVRDRDQKDNNK
jgi:hypothetical protein